jgi:hypothetical protein
MFLLLLVVAVVVEALEMVKQVAVVLEGLDLLVLFQFLREQFQ